MTYNGAPNLDILEVENATTPEEAVISRRAFIHLLALSVDACQHILVKTEVDVIMFLIWRKWPSDVNVYGL